MADYNIHIKETKECFLFRCKLSDSSVEKFKYKLRTVSWDSITNSSDTNKAYDNFIEIFSSLYNECFPKKKIRLKSKNSKRIVRKKTEIVRKIL